MSLRSPQFEVRTDEHDMPATAVVELRDVLVEASPPHDKPQPLPVVSRHQIESKAHELWIASGGLEGNADHYWYEAEHILDGERFRKRGQGTWFAALDKMGE